MNPGCSLSKYETATSTFNKYILNLSILYINTLYTTFYRHGVSQASQKENSPLQEKVKIFLRHVLSVISSLRLDLRSARLSVILVALTGVVTLCLTLRQRGVWADSIPALIVGHICRLGTSVRAVSSFGCGLIIAFSLLLTAVVHGRGVGGELGVHVCWVWQAVLFKIHTGWVGTQALSSLVDVVVVVAVLGLTLSYSRTCCPLESGTLIGWQWRGLWCFIPVPSFCRQDKFRWRKSKTHRPVPYIQPNVQNVLQV